jgi:D-serine deaminase-like pyridoxal phosphate-dependent protein
VGVCCQKVSEAEVFARGGIKDMLVSNQVRDPAKIDRLARIPKLGARAICCVDDLANVADLSAAAVKHGTTIECLVEIDCGAGRCGVKTTPEVVALGGREGVVFHGFVEDIAPMMDGIRLGQPVKCVRVDGGWGGTMRVGLSMPQIAWWNALSGEALAAQLAADMARIADGLSAAAQRQTG